jgi:hypothetical protein
MTRSIRHQPTGCSGTLRRWQIASRRLIVLLLSPLCFVGCSRDQASSLSASHALDQGDVIRIAQGTFYSEHPGDLSVTTTAHFLQDSGMWEVRSFESSRPLGAKHSLTNVAFISTEGRVVRHGILMQGRYLFHTTPAERDRADRLSRLFAISHLGLHSNKVAGLVSDVSHAMVSQNDTITLQFYDTNVFKAADLEWFPAFLGGFPGYFTVTVSTRSWAVVDHYASPQ